MTFPLGSLRAEPGAPTSSSATTTPPRVVPHWRARLALGIGAVLWLLALIALVTHSAADPAFTTSGSVEQAANKAGALGALVSDALYFLFGFSAWWLMLVSLRAWLGGLARVLRSEHASTAPAAPVDPHEPPAWLFWVGVVVLLAASCALENTRLYQFEAGVAGGHAGGVLGHLLGPASQTLLGFAGSGVLWIAALVAGLAMSLRFSWLRVAEAIGTWLESFREKRAERIERAEDIRLGERALREREEVVEVEHHLQEEHLPIVIEAPLPELEKSKRVAKERQKPLFTELADTKLPQVDLLDAAPGRQESVAPETIGTTSSGIQRPCFWPTSRERHSRVKRSQ